MSTECRIKIYPADKQFSAYIKDRDGWTCQKCGTKYDKSQKTSLQCSHNIKRGNFNIRWNADNALSLCYACHVFWYESRKPETQKWLKQKIGAKRFNRLHLLNAKSGGDKQPPKSKMREIEAVYRLNRLAYEAVDEIY